VVFRGNVCGGPARLHGLFQSVGVPGVLGERAQDAEEVKQEISVRGGIGGCGPASFCSVGQVAGIPGTLEQPYQDVAEVIQLQGAFRVALRDSSYGSAGGLRGLLQCAGVTGVLGERTQDAEEVRQDGHAVGVAVRSSSSGGAGGLPGLGQRVWAPVHSYSACKALLKLWRTASRSGWPSGVVATAARPISTASSSTAVSPVRSARG
jgi:hypothetical protein